MTKRQLDHVLIRKYVLDFPPERRIKSVVVIYIQKPAILKIVPQVAGFRFSETYVPMTCHIHKGIHKQFFGADLNKLFRLDFHIDVRVVAKKREHVDLGRRVVVPIAPASVFQTGDDELAGLSHCLRHAGLDTAEDADETKDRDATTCTEAMMRVLDSCMQSEELASDHGVVAAQDGVLRE
jgi:hypothetical protein